MRESPANTETCKASLRSLLIFWLGIRAKKLKGCLHLRLVKTTEKAFTKVWVGFPPNITLPLNGKLIGWHMVITSATHGLSRSAMWVVMEAVIVRVENLMTVCNTEESSSNLRERNDLCKSLQWALQDYPPSSSVVISEGMVDMKDASSFHCLQVDPSHHPQGGISSRYYCR